MSHNQSTPVDRPLSSSLPTPYYDHNGIVIYHGDCREILRAHPDGAADLVLTDPPYGVGLRYAESYSAGGSDEMSNLRTLCWTCNSRKAAAEGHERRAIIKALGYVR